VGSDILAPPVGVGCVIIAGKIIDHGVEDVLRDDVSDEAKCEGDVPFIKLSRRLDAIKHLLDNDTGSRPRIIMQYPADLRQLQAAE